MARISRSALARDSSANTQQEPQTSCEQAVEKGDTRQGSDAEAAAEATVIDKEPSSASCIEPESRGSAAPSGVSTPHGYAPYRTATPHTARLRPIPHGYAPYRTATPHTS